jgi:hypothetical protein
MPSLRRLMLIVAATTCFSFCALADQPAVERNGDWLMSGIRTYERLQSGDTNLSPQDAQIAMLVFGYIRGVLDVQDSNVMKALVAQGAIQNATKDRQKLDPTAVQQMDALAGYYVPLSHSEYANTQFTAAQAVKIVRLYLEQHPDQRAQRASQLIEAAFLDALPATDKPR